MNAYSNHIGSCQQQKKRMSSALGAAQEKYRNKKARLEPVAHSPPDVLDKQPIPAINVRSANFMPNCNL